MGGGGGGGVKKVLIKFFPRFRSVPFKTPTLVSPHKGLLICLITITTNQVKSNYDETKKIAHFVSASAGHLSDYYRTFEGRVIIMNKGRHVCHINFAFSFRDLEKSHITITRISNDHFI